LRETIHVHLKHLGPYEICKPLGKGGMGSVFAAVDTQTGQHVAIKALTPHLAMAEGFRERFEAEIESLKTLRHEGIVRLYGYGEQDGVLFYSMELVEGVSLEDELKAGRRFNWRDVSSIAIQLSLALKHAHDHGIVHRDIKPANVLLYGDDRVKLADFGIARLFGNTQLTTAGGVLGTADYMSPEQADGRPVTARCDQYSLGGVMYTLLAGRPPFQAKSLPQMLQLQRFAKPEPVRRYAPDTPAQLERVIMQLLSKNPADRFPNTQVLARHLQAMVNALSRPAADDFALGGEPHDADPHDSTLGPVLETDATQLEAHASRQPGSDGPIAGAGPVASGSHDAPTMGADELVANRGTSGNASALAAEAHRVKVSAPDGTSARFTTLEEDQALRRAEQQRSRLVVAGQLALLVAVLIAMGAAALYLAAPPSADKLYRTIVSQASSADDASLAGVEEEIEQFLSRFPADPRAVEMARTHKQIALDKAERRLQREARGGGSSNSSLLPVERLYLQAVNHAEISPENAVATLRSIVDLYGVKGTSAEVDKARDATSTKNEAADDGATRVSIVVELAERRLTALTAELTRQRDAQLAALDERLKTAQKLSSNNPQQAATMYRAIINLHQNDAWADRVVAEARRRLAPLVPLPK
jgi:serine/threonine-protein kinase